MRTLSILLVLLAWAFEGHAADKQWSIELSHHTQQAQAQTAASSFHDADFKPQIYHQQDDTYVVVLSGYESYAEVLQARKKLLKQYPIKASDMLITTQIYDEQQRVRTQEMPSAQEYPRESMIVHVLLNGSDAGEHFLETTGNDFFVTGKFLRAMGVTTLSNMAKDDESISLNSLHQQLSYTLDTQTGDLLLSVRPELLPQQEESLAVKRQSQAQKIQSDALFLNYTLDYAIQPKALNTFTAPLELGINIHGISFINMFQYHQKMYRTKTQLTYDREEHLQRWVVGDIQGTSGIASASLAGLHVFKNFSMDSTLVTTPGLETSITLDTASEVEVLMDGVSVYKGNFLAGVLNLKDIPFYRSGSIQAELVVRDAFGRVHHYNQMLYGSVGMLAQGLSEYDYALGVARSNTGFVTSYGKKTMFYGHYRYGVASWFTPALGLESDGQYARINMTSSVLLGEYGQVDTQFAASRLMAGSGYFVRINYNDVGSEVFSPSVFFSTQSLAYGGLNDAPKDVLSTQSEVGASLSTYMEGVGGLTGRWSQTKDYANNKGQTTSLVFNSNLPGNISLTTQFTRQRRATQATSNQISASLGHSFSNGLYLSASYDTSNNQNATFSLQLQWSPPLGEGFGFTETLNQQANGSPSSYSRVEYRNQYAETSLSATTGQQTGQYQARLRSAFVWTEGGVYVSRPVRDSFALVRVNGVHDPVKVKLRNQDIGKTNDDGEMIVPYMNAYSDDVIAIEPEALSFGYKISKTSQNIVTSYRGGGLVEFDVEKLQMVEGTIVYQIGNQTTPAQYSTIEFMHDGKKKTTVVGDGGALYLENLKAGVYTLKVYDDVHTCHVDVHVSESDNMVNDLGRIVCVVDKATK